ncbi:MAG: TfoX/Sxy family protein [Anaerolineaceae bacterium]|nr:TfoX/Sxy family protein [Anaerolineaceae bacterium]
MAFDEQLASRIKATLGPGSGVVEKKMFGGVAYLINGNMACGVHGNRMIVRIGPERYQDDLTKPHIHPFDLTGKPMAGWIVVDPLGISTGADLNYWIDRGMEFVRTLPSK